MARSAKLTSVDAVGRFAAAMISFEEETSGALTSLDLAVHRIHEWIHHDRPNYWKQEVRRRRDRLAEARVDLERCMAYRATDERPSCHDEKVALETAKRRLRSAEEKTEVVRHWARVIDRELFEFRGSLAQLSQWTHADYPKALAALERMAAALESYVALESSAESMTNSGLPSAAAEAGTEARTDGQPSQEEPSEPEEDAGGESGGSGSWVVGSG